VEGAKEAHDWGDPLDLGCPGILRSDAARDAMSTTFDKKKVFNFVQTSSRSSKTVRTVATRLHAFARAHGGDSRLLNVAGLIEAAALRKGNDDGRFDKIFKILNNVKKDLTKESSDDKDKKDECETTLTEKTGEAQTSANVVDEKSRLINRTRFEVTDLYAVVNKTIEEVEELEWELNDATMQREETTNAYSKEKAGLQAAISFIKQATKALEKFYDDNNLNLVQVQRQPELVVEAGKAPPPPPTTITKEYKGASANGGIQGILAEIQADVETDLGELNDNEKNSVKDFEDLKKDLEDQVATKIKFKEEKEKQIAGKLDDISTANEAKIGEQDTLDALVDTLKAAEPSCNYVFTTFETRIENRKIEAEGVNDAISALGGDPAKVEHVEASEK